MVSISANAQLEYSKWWWQGNHLLDFSGGGAPIYGAGPGSMIVGNERPLTCASICDRFGNLQFGATTAYIFDNQGNVMPNGNILGHDDEGQVAIVPKPCDPDIFYVFRTEEHEPTAEFDDPFEAYVSTIDLSQNGGLGTVIKHDTLDTTNFVEFAIGRHANAKDFWVIYLDLETGKEFNTYLVSDTGYSKTPITSITTQPPYPSHEGSGGTGSMRLSPSTEYLVLSHFVADANPSFRSDRLFKFDNTTGQVTFFCDLNDTVFNYNGSNGEACFSPEETKLYVSTGSDLWQFDLSSGIADTIANSGIYIIDSNTTPLPYLFEMQIGLDGAIYMPRSGTIVAIDYNKIAVIKNPDSLGQACHFVWDSITTTGPAHIGLPEFIYNLYVKREIETDLFGCTGDTSKFWFDKTIYLDSVHWYVGDNTSPQQFFSNDTMAEFIIDSVGEFPITAYAFSPCRIDTFSDSIEVIPSPNPNLGPDTILCEGDTIDLTNEWYYSYLWSTGDTTEGIQILLPDTYWLQLTNFCGSASDTVVIDSIIAALVNFPTDDTLLCDGDTLHLTGEVDAGSYLWHDGSIDSVNDITAAALAWVRSENACAVSTDTINVRFTDIPEIPDLDTILCDGDSVFINLITDSLSTFLWHNGDTTGFDTITTENQYWVEETNLCGQDRDTFFVAYVSPLMTHLGEDVLQCHTETFTLDASTRFGTYKWQDGSADSVFKVDSTLFTSVDSTWVWVHVTNACGSDTDSVKVVVDRPLNPELGPDLVRCIGDSIVLSVNKFPRSTYAWKGVNAASVIEPTAVAFVLSQNGLEQTVSVSVKNTCGTYPDDVVIFKDKPLTPKLRKDFWVCFGDSVNFKITANPRVSPAWSTQDTGTIIQYTAGNAPFASRDSTQVWVEETNQCGTYSDTAWVYVDSLPRKSMVDTAHFCDGFTDTIDLRNPTADAILWPDGSTQFIRPVSEQIRWVVTYTNRCGDTKDTVASKRIFSPKLEAESPVKLCGHTVLLAPEINQLASPFYGPMHFIWNNDHQLEWYDAEAIGTYQLTAINRFGCKDSIQVQVKTCGADFYIANSFTPNGDGVNEYWKPVGEGLFEFTCQLYNRWGEMIVQFTELDAGWDGTQNGHPLQEGVYQYRLIVNSEDFSQKNEFTGQVILIR